MNANVTKLYLMCASQRHVYFVPLTKSYQKRYLMAEHFPTAIRPQQKGGCPKIKVCLPWGGGGEGLFVGEGSHPWQERGRKQYFLAL